jgi:transposase
MKRRKQFSREFKVEAVRLLEEGQKPGAELARELGVKRNQLYKWKEEITKHKTEAFPGSGRRSAAGAQVTEIARLKKEVVRLQEENDILKKAAAFFARELK